MADVKFSQFANGGTLQQTDITVGLRAGVNTQFTQPIPPADPTLQDTYDASPDGNTDLVAGKPVTWSSINEGIRAPSMTLAQAGAITAPLNGLNGWLSDTGRPFYNAGTPGTPDLQQGAYLSDISSLTPDASYGEMYFTGNATPTTIVSTGIPVKVNATYNTGALLNFTQLSGTLTYTGATTIGFDASVVASATMDLGADTIQIMIYKNGALVTSSVITYDLDSVSPSFKATPGQSIVPLATNDYVEIFVANLSSTDDIIVESLNCSVTSIGGSNDINDQVVILWDGSATPVSVTGSTYIDITGGTISYTGNALPDLQDVYDNSGISANINIVAGTPITYSSTTEGSRVASMTQAQSNAISLPLNGLEVWQNNTNRKAINAGTPGTPAWQQVAWLTDISAANGQSAVYTPTLTAVSGCGGLTVTYCSYSTISITPGNICTAFINMLYTPTSTVAVFQVSIPLGAVFATAQQAWFSGGTSYVTSTQLTPSDFKNLQSNIGTANIVMGVQVPAGATGVANTLAFSFSYVIN